MCLSDTQTCSSYFSAFELNTEITENTLNYIGILKFCPVLKPPLLVYVSASSVTVASHFLLDYNIYLNAASLLYGL